MPGARAMAAGIMGVGPRRRIARTATIATTAMMKTTAMTMAKTGKLAAALETAFSGHCEDGMVLPGAVSYWVLACAAAMLSTSSLAEARMTKKTSFALAKPNRSPTVLLDESAK